VTGWPAAVVILSERDKNFLDSQVRKYKAPRSLSDRCLMILLCAQGLHINDVAERLSIHEHTVGKWRRPFCSGWY
jgi:putative transposase